MDVSREVRQDAGVLTNPSIAYFREATMLRRSWPLLLVALAVGCSSGGPASGDGDSSAAAGDRAAVVAGTGGRPAEFDLYEPVVRHLMKPLETRAAPRPWAVYVTVPHGLSAEAFCKRFEGHPIPVLVFSDAAFDTAGQSAYIIQICNPSARTVRWEGPDRASILVSHHAMSEPFCGCDKPYPVPVHLDGGKWVVGE
jgi:hypothetical protein